MSELAGKVALVTGGSRGIGAAVATRMAELGADVAITYAQSKERADDVVDAIKAHGRRGLAIKADRAAADGGGGGGGTGWSPPRGPTGGGGWPSRGTVGRRTRWSARSDGSPTSSADSTFWS